MLFKEQVSRKAWMVEALREWLTNGEASSSGRPCEIIEATSSGVLEFIDRNDDNACYLIYT